MAKKRRVLVRGRCKNCKSAFSAETRAKLRELADRFFTRLLWGVLTAFAGELLSNLPATLPQLAQLGCAPKTPGHKRHRNPMAKPVEKSRKKGGPQ
jgi:hypothetical protein